MVDRVDGRAEVNDLFDGSRADTGHVEAGGDGEERSPGRERRGGFVVHAGKDIKFSQRCERDRCGRTLHKENLEDFQTLLG